MLYIKTNAAKGFLQLPADLSSDHYHLRAYTSWLRNIGEFAFARVPLLIVNSFATEIKEDEEQKYDKLQSSFWNFERGYTSYAQFLCYLRNIRNLSELEYVFPPCQVLCHLTQKSYLYVKIKDWLCLQNIHIFLRLQYCDGKNYSSPINTKISSLIVFVFW